MSSGDAICIVVCALIALFHLKVGIGAMNWRGAENYESLLFLIAGIPLFAVQIALSIVLFVRLRGPGSIRAFAAQIPLVASLLMVLAYAGR
jgi:hypothetical protein